MDVFDFSAARWSSHLTKGTPPLGIIGYCCATSHSNIYYYGGWCGHGLCHHNSLNVFNTVKMSWSPCNESSTMKKAYAEMISLEFDGAEWLLIIGGLGSTPTVYHPQFQYDQLKDGRVRTNEQLLYNVSTGKILLIVFMYVHVDDHSLHLGQFTIPSFSGTGFPPTSSFTIAKINNNKGIMFGGRVTVNGKESAATNSAYIFSVTHKIIVS